LEFYQIELIDANMAAPLMQQEADEQEENARSFQEKTVKFAGIGKVAKFPHDRLPSQPAETSSVVSGASKGKVGSKGAASRFHRLVKHKNMHHLHK
jgi:hypothetical protein